MTGLNGKITVDNTLGARLEIAKDEVSLFTPPFIISFLLMSSLLLDVATNPCCFV
jgi:hypothetical protein